MKLAGWDVWVANCWLGFFSFISIKNEEMIDGIGYVSGRFLCAMFSKFYF